MQTASDLRAGGSDVSSGVSVRRHLGLDGLRGLAVAWVVLFHLWPDVVPGGWLGVGLFFTLSGYLVVGLIDAEVSASGRLRLGRFMARRVRRLMPAALLTIASVLALTAALDDQALREVGFDALTAVLNVFNWRTALDTAGYAAIFEARPEPLAHFWSLAIEEQFYLLFPAAAALTRRTALVVWAMVIAGLVGVVLWWGSADAYVATPVRALEIAAGAGLALVAERFSSVERLMNPDPNDDSRLATKIAGGVIFAVAVGVTVVALARLGPQDSLVFRGGPQLMALCWVVWVVAAIRDGIPARIMSAGVLRWLGTRSYAIYLFHWPLIELTDWHPVMVIATTLIAAEASYRLVEIPVRDLSGLQAMPPLICAAVAVALIATATVAISTPARATGQRTLGHDQLPDWAHPVTTTTTPRTNGDQTNPNRAEATQPTTTSTVMPVMPPSTTTPTVIPAPITGTDTGPPPPTTSAAPTPASETVPIVTVIGDSTAAHIAYGLRLWADSTRSMAVVDRSVAACSPVSRAEWPWRVVRVGTEGENPSDWSIQDESCRNDYIEPGSRLVLVVDHAIPQFEHRRTDGSWATMLDADLARDVEDSYRKLVENAGLVDAEVVFTVAPRLLHYNYVGIQPDPARGVAYNSLLQTLVEEYQPNPEGLKVSLIDTATELDASGHDGRYGRSDGFHLNFDRSEAFAVEVLGPALLDLLTNN